MQAYQACHPEEVAVPSLPSRYAGKAGGWSERFQEVVGPARPLFFFTR
jgi:hypothetical protein